MSPKGVEHRVNPKDFERRCEVHSSMSPKGVEHGVDPQEAMKIARCAFINVAERR